MRSRFDRQLELLNESLIEMGTTIEEVISITTDALIRKDITMAEKINELETEINEKEKDIESLCLKLLLQQHPVASDLRTISAALKMITDMERIGDQATDISEISVYLAEYDDIVELSHIKQMGEAVIEMVSKSIEAYVKKDINIANKVIRYDDVVDNLFIRIKDELYEKMLAKKDNGKQALDILMIAKYYERIGDHAQNIAEWVIFSITGVHKHV